MPGPQGERSAHQSQLGQAPLVSAGPNTRQVGGGHFAEQRLTGVVVDRPAVVGINKRQVPQFGALVQVRHAGSSQCQ